MRVRTPAAALASWFLSKESTWWIVLHRARIARFALPFQVQTTYTFKRILFVGPRIAPSRFLLVAFWLLALSFPLLIRRWCNVWVLDVSLHLDLMGMKSASFDDSIGGSFEPLIMLIDEVANLATGHSFARSQ